MPHLKLFLPLLLLASTDYSKIYQSAADFASKEEKSAFNKTEQVNSEEWVSKDVEGFDPERAEEMALSEERTGSELESFVLGNEHQANIASVSFNEDEHFIKHSDELLEDPISSQNVVDSGVEYETHKCHEGGGNYAENIIREMQVTVIHHPEEVLHTHLCEGHKRSKKDRNKSNLRRDKKLLEQQFKDDPEIESFDVKLNHGWFKSELSWTWQHKDNAKTCDHYETKSEVLREESWAESSKWVYTQGSLEQLEDPSRTIIESVCLDSSPKKVINGKEVEKPCWKQRISQLCSSPQQDGCAALKAKNCNAVAQKCLEEVDGKCLKWEKTYKCYKRFSSSSLPATDFQFICSDGNCQELDYNENTSFSEAATKLSVYQEMQNELASQDASAENFRFFSGRALECSKSVAGDKLYDCCGSMDGFAVDIHLAKCSADEKYLAKSRYDGYCVFVGSYDKKLAGFKTSTRHSYCCFPSKLARVFQEQARLQLGIAWGSPKKPNCAGLTEVEIAAVDISKVDLSELFSDTLNKVPSNLSESIEAMQGRLSNKLSKRAEEKK